MSAFSTLKQRVGVPEALALIGVSVGEDGKIPCPFHDDDTPSLHIYDTRWYAYCCGRHGDVFDLLVALVPEIESAGQAYAFLHGRFDIKDRPVIQTPMREIKDFRKEFLNKSLPKLDHAHVLMKAKGWHRLFSTQDLWEWGVRANPVQLLIPHENDGWIVGVKTRKLATGEKGAWKGSTFTTQPYQPREWNPEPEITVICEGESDAWALCAYYADEPMNVLALPSGAHSWRSEWRDRWVRSSEVWLFLDNDRAGDEAEEIIRKDIPWASRISLPENDVVATLLEGWRLPRP